MGCGGQKQTGREARDGHSSSSHLNSSAKCGDDGGESLGICVFGLRAHRSRGQCDGMGSHVTARAVSEADRAKRRRRWRTRTLMTGRQKNKSKRTVEVDWKGMGKPLTRVSPRGAIIEAHDVGTTTKAKANASKDAKARKQEAVAPSS